MIEQAVSRIVSGALWGAGAGLVWRVISGNKKDGAQQGSAGVPLVRPIAKTAMKSVIIASDRARGVLSEARESLEDLYAEAQAETHSNGAMESMPSKPADRGNIPIEA